MYVNPVLVGVVLTVLTEVAMVMVAVMVTYYKDNKRR